MSGTRWSADRARRGESFGSVAADHAAWRPGYPADVVAFLAGGDAIGVRPARTWTTSRAPGGWYRGERAGQARRPTANTRRKGSTVLPSARGG